MSSTYQNNLMDTKSQNKKPVYDKGIEKFFSDSKPLGCHIIVHIWAVKPVKQYKLMKRIYKWACQTSSLPIALHKINDERWMALMEEEAYREFNDITKKRKINFIPLKADDLNREIPFVAQMVFSALANKPKDKRIKDLLSALNNDIQFGNYKKIIADYIFTERPKTPPYYDIKLP